MRKEAHTPKEHQGSPIKVADVDLVYPIIQHKPFPPLLAPPPLSHTLPTYLPVCLASYIPCLSPRAASTALTRHRFHEETHSISHLPITPERTFLHHMGLFPGNDTLRQWDFSDNIAFSRCKWWPVEILTVLEECTPVGPLVLRDILQRR